MKKEEFTAIHLSEIDLLMVANTQVSFTCVALNELIKSKAKIIFCDEKHNPLCEAIPFYGSYNSSKRIEQQIKWKEKTKGEVFREIVIQKIKNQATLLKNYRRLEEYTALMTYANEVEFGDLTNREGHAAKVYFNALWGMDFSRTRDLAVNHALDYGYTILLSYISREIVSNGCLTQWGIKHCNEYNQFNLSCDIIEPFRQIVDRFVLENPPPMPLDTEYKFRLTSLLSIKVRFNGQDTFLSNAISSATKSIIDALDKDDISKLKLYEL